MFNKYEVQSDARVDAEANFSSNKGSLEVVHFFTLFRGECKDDLHVNLVRQFLALEVYFLRLNLTGKKGSKFLRMCMKNDLFQKLRSILKKIKKLRSILQVSLLSNPRSEGQRGFQ